MWANALWLECPEMLKPTVLDLIVHEEHAAYWAEAPAHPGLFASGETLDELVEAATEALRRYNNLREPYQYEESVVPSMRIRVPA